MERIRCAICGITRDGDVVGDKLFGLTYLPKEKRPLTAIRVDGFWICANHDTKVPLRVKAGKLLVMKDNGRDGLRLEPVSKVKPSGSFEVGSTSYNPFGRRTRGYGEKTVLRIATEDDIRRDASIRAEKEAKWEASRQAKEAREKLEAVLVESLKQMLPENLRSSVVSVSTFYEEKYEFTLSVDRTLFYQETSA